MKLTKNTLDVTVNGEYDFLSGSDDIYLDFEGFDEEKYCPPILNLLPLKTEVMIKIQMNLQMFSKSYRQECLQKDLA